MEDKERKKLVRKLAEQMTGNHAEDFALEAMIKAMLKEDEHLEVTHQDTAYTHWIYHLNHTVYKNQRNKVEMYRK